jgi:thiamine-monophosphate kinase
MLMSIDENVLIDRFAGDLPRAPYQLNRRHDADAEILAGMWGKGNTRLALTIDTIAEEISSGLYSDPWLIGWMSVMVNMSDLAAVGAAPLGILLSLVIPRGYPPDSIERLRAGILQACRQCGTFVLGGDTNEGTTLETTGCAVGIIGPGRTMTRLGSKPGDFLYASGPLGAGSAFAYSVLHSPHPFPVRYQPIARLREGRILRSIVSSCMDTSDGALATLDQMMRLNRVGFLLESGWEGVLDPSAHTLAATLEVPPWLVLAGPHGEFELIFTVPERGVPALLTEAGHIGWHPVLLGRVIKEVEVRVCSGARSVRVDTGAIRNLAPLARLDPREYLHSIMRSHGLCDVRTTQ